MLPPPLPKQKSWLRTNWKCLSVFLIGSLLLSTLLYIRFFVIQYYQTPSGSMKPTILIGDRFLSEKISSAKEIKKGDIIVYRSPSTKTRLVKRVIGLPGEKFQISNRVVTIDGLKLEEKYLYKDDPQVNPTVVFQNADFGPLTVPDDSFFVLGDNRNNSADSRLHGPILFEDIIGKVRRIVWSWDPKKHEFRRDRFGKKVE